MLNLLTFGSLILLGYTVVMILRFDNIKDMLLAFWCAVTALITAWGYIISAMGYLGSITAWLYISLVSLAFAGVVSFNKKTDNSPQKKILWQLRQLLQEINLSPFYKKTIIYLLFFTSIPVSIATLYLVLCVTPHNWDSMTTHLPRMAQYIQQGNLLEFSSDNWAQITQPKGSTILFIYAFLISGHNENLTQMVQFLSLWVVALATFGISRKLGWGKVESLFSALISSLLVSNITQASTNLNDLLIASYFGTGIYFLFCFRETHSYKNLYLSAIGLGLAIGVKASSFSAIPSFFLLLFLVVWEKSIILRAKHFLFFLIFLSIASFVFILPSGYVNNYLTFGNVIGDQNAESIHSFSGASANLMLQGGLHNMLRYGMDFLSLDGFSPSSKTISDFQHFLRLIPIKVLASFRINLESSIAITFFPFENYRPVSASETHSYWGVFGFCLVWTSVVWFLIRGKQFPDRFFMALAAIVFFIALSFSGPYDSSRGRYFSTCGIFAVPLTGMWINTKHRLAKAYLIAVVLLGCLSSISAVILKTTPVSSNYPNKVAKNILLLNRIGQLTYNNFSYYQPITEFEKQVPANAKVATFLYPNTFVYPLYGEKISREIFPTNSFYQGIIPIPNDAQYLLYAKGYPCPLPDDIHLGKDWFLRKLSKNNRECLP